MSMTLTSCGDFDEQIFDPTSDQTFAFFTGASSSINVVQGDSETTSVDIEVGVSTISTVARTVTVGIDETNTSATPNQYTLMGTATIPPNEFFGTFTVSGNFDDLSTSTVALVLLIEDTSDEGSATSSETHTVTLRRTE